MEGQYKKLFQNALRLCEDTGSDKVFLFLDSSEGTLANQLEEYLENEKVVQVLPKDKNTTSQSPQRKQPIQKGKAGFWVWW